MKKFLAVLLTIVMLFSLTACTPDNTSSDIDISKILAMLEDEYNKNSNVTSSQTTTPDINVSSSQPNTPSTPQQSSSQNQTQNSTVSNTTDTITNNSNFIPEENKVQGKPFSEILASIPQKLSGSTITIFNWNPISEYVGAHAVINDFKAKTGIDVEWITVNYKQYFSKIAASVASGHDIPDVARLRSVDPAFLTNFQPLSVTNYDFNDRAWDDKVMKAYTFGNNTYGTSIKNTHIGSCDMLFYNKKLIANYEDPYTLWKNGQWTWSKYLEICRQYKSDTGNSATTGEGMSIPYFTIHGLGGTYSFDGSRYYNSAADAKTITVAQEIMDLYNSERLFRFGNADKFNNGSSLFYTGTAVHLRKNNSYFGNLKANNTIYAVPMPIPDGQTTYYQSMGEIEAYGIPKGASNPEAVPYFLRFFLDGALNNDNYNLSSYFVNEQNLEVYNWCMNQENKIVSAKLDPIGDIYDGLQSLKGADVYQFVSAHEGVINNYVNQLNISVEKLEQPQQ